MATTDSHLKSYQTKGLIILKNKMMFQYNDEPLELMDKNMKLSYNIQQEYTS